MASEDWRTFEGECLVELKRVNLKELPREIEIVRWTRCGDALLLIRHGVVVCNSGVVVMGHACGWRKQDVKNVLPVFEDHSVP